MEKKVKNLIICVNEGEYSVTACVGLGIGINLKRYGWEEVTVSTEEQLFGPTFVKIGDEVFNTNWIVKYKENVSNEEYKKFLND